MRKSLLLLSFILCSNQCYAENTKVYTDEDIRKLHQEKTTKGPSGFFETQRPVQIENTKHQATTEQLRRQIDEANERELRKIQQQEELQKQWQIQQQQNRIIQAEKIKSAEDKLATGAATLCTLFMIPIIFTGIHMVLWILALVDIIKHEFTGQNKLIWLLIIFFVPVIGPILYYFMGEKHKNYLEQSS